MGFSANRIMSGTFGKLLWDGYEIAECSACQAKHTYQREDQQLPGEMAIDSKVTGTKGTGSVTLKKVFSRFADYTAAVQRGEDPRSTLIVALDDPDAYGAERVALYNVSLDEMTLMDWQVGKTTDLTIPFRFTKSELLQGVEPR